MFQNWVRSCRGLNCQLVLAPEGGRIRARFAPCLAQTHHQAAESLGAASVDLVGRRTGRARKDGVSCAWSAPQLSVRGVAVTRTENTGVVVGRDVGVQARRRQLGEGDDGDEGALHKHDGRCCPCALLDVPAGSIGRSRRGKNVKRGHGCARRAHDCLYSTAPWCGPVAVEPVSIIVSLPKSQSTCLIQRSSDLNSMGAAVHMIVQSRPPAPPVQRGWVAAAANVSLAPSQRFPLLPELTCQLGDDFQLILLRNTGKRDDKQA